jgi:hypothetical protein
MERKTFRSRVSVLLIIFILIVISPGLILTIRSGNIFNPGFYTITGVIIFIAFISSGIRYVVTDRLLLKMWGIPCGSYPISQIVSVKRSYNPLSSPAASLKRLCVRFKQGYKWPFVLISPAREQEFLEKLEEINPDIDIQVNNRKARYRIRDWDI